MSTTTTTSPVTVVYSRQSFISVTVIMVPISVGKTILDQPDMVLLPQYITRDIISSSVGCTSPLCHSNSNLSLRCLLRHMPTMACVLHRWVFSFRVEPPTNSYVIIWVCYGVCILLPGSHVTVMFTNGGSNVGVCHTTSLWSKPLEGICTNWWWSVAHARYVLSGCTSQLLCVGASSCYQFSCPPAISTIW